MHSTPVNFSSYLFAVPYDEKQFNSDLVSQLELTLFDCRPREQILIRRYGVFRGKIYLRLGNNLLTGNK